LIPSSLELQSSGREVLEAATIQGEEHGAWNNAVVSTYVREGNAYPVVEAVDPGAPMIWTTRIPGNSRLRFGVAARAEDGYAGELPDVSITLAREGEQDEEIFRHTLGPDELTGQVVEREIAIPGTEGTGNLVFAVLTDSGPDDRVRPTVKWHNPVILAPGQESMLNLIVICVDTLRADRLEAIGGESKALPRLDARLEEATVFRNAYSNAPWTLPAISTILTGVFPSVHGAGMRSTVGSSEKTTDYSAKDVGGGIELTISNTRYRYQMLHHSVPTIQEVLRPAGYYSAAIHSNGYINYPTRVLKGMDYFVEIPGHDAQRGTDRAIEWISAQQNTQFFLFLHYIDPHQWVKDVPADVMARVSESPMRASAEDQAVVLEAYDERILHVDEHLDRFLSTLDDLGLDERTLLVFLSDHGERFFDHGVVGSHGGSNLEGVIRIPLAIWGPGISPGQVDTTVQLVDVAPTMLDLLGVHFEESTFSGRSLKPLLQGVEASSSEVISEFMLWSSEQQHSIIRGDWKYTWSESGAQLYNLSDDPGETQNLAGEHADTAAQMHEILEVHLQRGEELRAARQFGATELDEATLDSLKALGYVDGEQ